MLTQCKLTESPVKVIIFNIKMDFGQTTAPCAGNEENFAEY